MKLMRSTGFFCSFFLTNKINVTVYGANDMTKISFFKCIKSLSKHEIIAHKWCASQKYRFCCHGILHNCASQKATNCWQTSRIETWNETWFIIIIEQSLQLMETNAMKLIHAVVLAVHVNGHLMEWINKKSTDYTIERPNDDQSVSHNSHAASHIQTILSASKTKYLLTSVW